MQGLRLFQKAEHRKSINLHRRKKEEKANEGEQCDEKQNRTRSQSL